MIVRKVKSGGQLRLRCGFIVPISEAMEQDATREFVIYHPTAEIVWAVDGTAHRYREGARNAVGGRIVEMLGRTPMFDILAVDPPRIFRHLNGSLLIPVNADQGAAYIAWESDAGGYRVRPIGSMSKAVRKLFPSSSCIFSSITKAMEYLTGMALLPPTCWYWLDLFPAFHATEAEATAPHPKAGVLVAPSIELVLVVTHGPNQRHLVHVVSADSTDRYVLNCEWAEVAPRTEALLQRLMDGENLRPISDDTRPARRNRDIRADLGAVETISTPVVNDSDD